VFWAEKFSAGWCHAGPANVTTISEKNASQVQEDVLGIEQFPVLNDSMANRRIQ
jgi:hypothetical protein